MTNPLQRVANNARYGSQRLPTVPKLGDEDAAADLPVGTFFSVDEPVEGGEEGETKNNLFIKTGHNENTKLTGAGTGTGGPVTEEFDGDLILPGSIPSSKFEPNTIGNLQLANGAISGNNILYIFDAVARVYLVPPLPDYTPLTIDTILPAPETDILRVLNDGEPRFVVGPKSASVGGFLLPDAAFSVYSHLPADTLIKGRTPGDFLYFEDETGLPRFTINADGDTFVSGDFVAEGVINTQGGLSVDGPLTVTEHATITGGMQVGEDLYVGGAGNFDGQVTFTGSLILPSGYGAKLGSAAWLKSDVGASNRITVEGGTTPGIAEIQLGSGGPVLRNPASDPGELWINNNRVLVASAGGLAGSQLAKDTITGGASAGQGNIAGQTIQAWNIKDGSVTRAKLVVGAVGQLELDPDLVIDDEQILTVSAAKLISGVLNASEIFMGPNGTIYMGPVNSSQITQQRVQLDAVGLRSYGSTNDTVAEVRPGFFQLRSATSGARINVASDSGLTLYDVDNTLAAQLSPSGVFSLQSKYAGSRTVLDSQDGLRFVASPTRNMAFNPGFVNGSQAEVGFNAERTDDQLHVFAGEYSVRIKATETNPATESYADVPFRNTVGTNSTYTRTRVNACTNPSLATVITGWSAVLGSATGTRQTGVVGFMRPNVLRLVTTSAGSATILAPVTTGIAAGQQWTLSCNVRCNFAASAIAVVQWISSADVVLSEEQALPVTMRAGIVEPIWVTGTAPANTAKLRLKIIAPLSSGYTFEVSQALYERASGFDEYADGDTQGFQWNGTAGNSASSLIPAPIPDSANNLISIYVWSEVPAFVRIEGRDSTAGVGRGISPATALVPNQWNRVSVACTGVMDKVRLHAPTSDIASQLRTTDYVWYSGLQVERDVTRPTPFCAGSEPGSTWEGVPYSSASVRGVDVVTTALSPSLGVQVSGAIVGGSITGSAFFAGLVSASEIRGGLIKGNVLQGNYITGDQIVANTLTGDKILANTLISNVSLQTGVSGRRVLISGPNNSIRFFPQADETRYAELYSYVPTGLPDDISVELRSINSAAYQAGNLVSRVRVSPNECFIGVTDKNDNATLSGGVAYFNQTSAFVGVKTGLISAPGNKSGMTSYNTGEIQFNGWFGMGFWGADQACGTAHGTVPAGYPSGDFGFGGFTMASAMVPVICGLRMHAISAQQPATQIFGAWAYNVTRTKFTVVIANPNFLRGFHAWCYRNQP